MSCSKCGDFHDEVIRLSEAIHAEGKATEGYAAAKLWEWSNRASVPVDLATRVMESLGYIPFQGYPLVLRNTSPRRPFGGRVTGEIEAIHG